MIQQPAYPSLLYPSGANRAAAGRPALSEADLGLASIIRALDYDGRHARFVAGVLAELATDPATIVYRQDVLADLLDLPDLQAACAAVLPRLEELAAAGRTKRWGDNIPLVQVADRLGELENYFACVEALWAALDAAGDHVRAAGLLALRSALAAAREHPDHRRLAQELPNLRAQLDQAGSITLGINLDPQLRPESATIVSVNPRKFAGKGSLLDRLLGDRGAADAVRGIAALYKAEEGGRQRAPEHDLFRDMERLLERVAAPVASALASFARMAGVPLAGFAPELAFYLGAARLAEDLRAAGLPLCRPSIAAAEQHLCDVEAAYSLDLALRLRASSGSADFAKKVVCNDASFGPAALIAILTGPNSGGKTTYTRAIGQIQVLSQAGLLVPGRRALISPVDAIFTHFAAPERTEIGGGRLAEELERLADMFRRATSTSLVLLNEPLASTDHGAARLLSRDVVAGLLLLGARAIFVTHLHELLDDMLDGDELPRGVFPLAAGYGVPADDGTAPAPSYVIAPGRPEIAGYAAELARRHGLGREQIAAMLRGRGAGQNDILRPPPKQ